MEWSPPFEQALRLGLRRSAVDPPVAAEESFSSLGVNSLGIVEIILLLEEYLGIEIPVEDLDPISFESPGSLWEAVRWLPTAVTAPPGGPTPGGETSGPPFR